VLQHDCQRNTDKNDLTETCASLNPFANQLNPLIPLVLTSPALSPCDFGRFAPPLVILPLRKPGSQCDIHISHSLDAAYDPLAVCSNTIGKSSGITSRACVVRVAHAELDQPQPRRSLGLVEHRMLASVTGSPYAIREERQAYEACSIWQADPLLQARISVLPRAQLRFSGWRNLELASAARCLAGACRYRRPSAPYTIAAMPLCGEFRLESL